MPEPLLGEGEAPEGCDLLADIAVVGLACRFPEAPDPETFWDNLRAGRESVRELRPAELAAAGVPPALIQDPAYVRARAVLEGIELFDHEFFELSSFEAAITDPQHRLLLECAAEALEHGGFAGASGGARVGVFAGSILSTYLLRNLQGLALGDAAREWQIALANAPDTLVSRISYKLDLKGPSVTVQTACSTALVAVHLARQSLLNFECDLALAGGVTVRVPQIAGYLYQEEGIHSPDGHCRAFDAAARGTVFGSGAGLVLLQRLGDALAQGATIYAVIKSSAINNDGGGKMGYTAPSAEGQAEVIERALALADCSAESIGYVEAHGTGTRLGDPIEVSALTAAFRRHTAATGFCALGSVKANLGHLDAAAGIAGLIKAILALRHGIVPPSLHFQQPNPEIDFAASPFYVNTAARPFPRRGGPRRAGVSAFGIGGTNAHVIVQEPPAAAATGPSRPWQLLLLSARTPAALERASARLAAHLEGEARAPLADLAFTLRQGRRAFEERRMVVCREAAEAARALAAGAAPVRSARVAARRPSLAFLFPGQGAQHIGMGRGLYETESVFRGALDGCAEILARELGLDLREVLYPGSGSTSESEARLRDTRLAQPALFAVEVALARLWLSWGLEPTALLGHSLGELTAAHLAGVMDLPTALGLVAARGRLMGGAAPGAMLAVELGEAAVQTWLGAGVELAAVNGAARTVVSGPSAAIADLDTRLAAAGISTSAVATSHAFHSAAMEPVLESFFRRVAQAALGPPQIPFISNVTGTWIEEGQARDPNYWVAQLRRPVRFHDGIGRLLAEPDRLLLEVGPGRGLASLARRHPARSPGQAVLASLPHREDGMPEEAAILDTLGQLWLAGAAPDWEAFSRGEVRRRVALPTYPFDRRRHWIEPRAADPAPVSVRAEDPAALRPPAPAATGTSPLEEVVAAVFAEVLGEAVIDPAANFFELGGDSLLALQVVNRLRGLLPSPLAVRQLFETPTAARLAAALRERLAAAGPEATPRPSSPGPAAEGPAELSFSQQRLWFLYQLDPGNPVYNEPSLLSLQGALAVAVLRRALCAVIERHEVLRSTFGHQRGAAFQAVLPTAELLRRAGSLLPVVDLCALPAAARTRQRDTLAARLARRTFDLERGPALALALLRLGAERHALALVLHHIICDGWSMGVLVRELVWLYDGLGRGEAVPLPPLPRQYADFAREQRAELSGPRREELVAYWRARLAGMPQVLELPLDRPRSAGRSARGRLFQTQLPAATLAGLRELGRGADATLFMVLAASWQALLSRVSGQGSFGLGTPVANRDRRDLEGLIGFFVNTLVLRAEVVAEEGFASLLARLRAGTLADLAMAELPFELVVDAVSTVRDLSLSPLFQVLFVLQNVRRPKAELAELAFEDLAVHNGTAKFDLTLAVEETPRGLAVRAEASADLFDATTIERLLGGWRSLLAAVLAAPTRPLASLELLAAAERQQLCEWNDTAATLGGEATLPELLAAEVERHPERIAVVDAVEALSAAELAARARRLAARLVTLGVGPEVHVAIAAERSVRMLVGILGVVQAGGAYIPIDPGYPRERVAFLLADAGAPVLLTEAKWLGELPARGTEVLLLDGDEAGGEGLGGASAPQPENLAYTIYTSGSTGAPKGAMNSHRGIVNRLLWMQRRYQLGAGDVVLQKTPASFDVSVWELFWPLLAGARLCFAKPGGHQDPVYLAQLIAEQGVTTLHFVPSMLQLFLEHVPVERLGGVRRVVVSGEGLPLELARRFAARSPAELHNLYGPTEAAVDVSARACTHLGDGATVSLGRPISNLRLTIVDRRGLPVLPGTPGELLIGGVGLARGYWRRPALTAERFIPERAAGEAGARVYRTGDLARTLADGEVEFLGRLDHQVKLHGLRIELGEVEAALLRHPEVREAVVLLRSSNGGGRLVAYVTGPAAAAAREIAAFLGPILPEYMVPSSLVVLAALPLSPNGKVDRRALPEPAADDLGEEEGEAPAGREEEILAAIWCQLLALPRVSRRGHFFELGGDSILGIQVVVRAREQGLSLTPRDLFRAPTLQALAALAVSHEGTAPTTAAPEEYVDARLSRDEREALFASIQRLEASRE